MKLLFQLFFFISLSCFSQTEKEFVIQFKPHISQGSITKIIRQHSNIIHWRIINSNKKNPFYNTVKFNSTSFELSQWNNTMDIEYIEELPQTFLATDTLPSDPYFPFQWEIDFMKTKNVWAELKENDTTLLVAIVDSGSDFDNLDLQGVYQNSNDPINGLDDDNNSFTDDSKGWDFGEYDNDPSVTENSSHGRQMTSLVASTTDNGEGMSSVGYNVRYLTAKITKDNGQIVDPYEGVLYAIDQGAKIINCSWYQYTSTVYSKRIVDYAFEKGVLLVAAAGNDNSSATVYPASDPTVLSVGAIKENISKTSSSNFGTWVDIYSPGSGIYVAFPNNTYAKTSGTSVACAITTSACCLLKKRFPTESPTQLIARIKRSGTPFTDQNISGKYINLSEATKEIEYDAITIFPNPVLDNSFDITLPNDFPKEKVSLELYNVLGQRVYQQTLFLKKEDKIINTVTDLEPGQYFLRLKSKNLSKTSSLTFAR